MAVDILQEKIRKTKNPSVLELTVSLHDLPEKFSRDAVGYGSFCRELLTGLKGLVPAVRISFGCFALLGPNGMAQLHDVLIHAREQGYYVLLDAPEVLSVSAANMTAEVLLGEESIYPCDGVVISGYLGSDVIKPFLPYCKTGKKDIFVVARTANKSASELQDLLTGSRLVHTVAADHVNRYGADTAGKFGYTRVGVLASASYSDGLRTLRSKYPKLFLLLDGYDYPNANAKNCSYAFDKFGHGVAVCAGTSITCAWKQTETVTENFIASAVAAAERMKKNLTRYITIL